MTVDVQKYADPDVVGGNADGSSWANAYSTVDAALAAECANGQDYSNINEATVTVTTAFTTANQTLTFTGSGATARFISLIGTTLQYEVLTGTPLGTDTTITGATEGSVTLGTIDDTSGGTVTINLRNSDTTLVSHSSTTVTDATNKLIIKGDFAAAKYDSTKAEISVGNATAVTIDTDYVKFENIQILWSPTTNSRRAINHTGTGHLETDGMLQKCAATGGNYIRGIVTTGDLTCKNSLFIDIKRGTNDYYVAYTGGAKTMKVYNCVLDNCYRGIWNNSTTAATVKNTAMNCNILSAGTGTTNFTNCASTGGTGTNPLTVSDWKDPDYFDNIFLDDYRTSWQSEFVGAGVGSSTDADVPSLDIFGNTRPAATTTDIGVHYDATQTTTDPLIELAFDETTGAVCENNYDSRFNAIIGEVLTVSSTSAAQPEYQSYAEDGTYAYVAGNIGPAVYQRNLALDTTIDSNLTPMSGLPTSPNVPNTIGGTQHYSGKLYGLAAYYSGATIWTTMVVAAWDTTTAGLPVDHYIDMSAEGVPASSVAIDDTDGEALAFSYSYGTKMWRYDLTSPYGFLGTIDTDIRIACNGAFYESASDSVYTVAKNPSATTGAERIYEFDMTGAVVGSWCDPASGELEDIEFNGTSFKSNSYSSYKVRTYTKPSAPTRTAGSFHLNEAYYIDLFAKIPDECTFIMGIKATAFKANNTVMDSHFSSGYWACDIDASGVFSFNIDGLNPVTYTLPSATTEYKVAITIGGSGVNRTVKLYVDDTLRDTQTQTWQTPPTHWWSLGAGNSNNTVSDLEFFYFMFDNSEYSSTEVSNYTPPTAPSSGILPLMMSYT